MSTQYNSSNKLLSKNIGYEELKLPFEQISTDYISGKDLYNALDSREMRRELSEYQFSSEFDKSDRSLEMKKDHDNYTFIEAEIDFERDYSNILLKLESNTPEKLESLEKDLDRVEKGLENHFTEDNSRYSNVANYGYTD